VPPRVSELRPEVPSRLDAAVARALEKRPEDRFPTMADLGRELEACLEELRSPGGAATMVIAPPRRSLRQRVQRRRRGRATAPLILVAIGLAIAVAALAIAIERERGSSGSPSSARGSGAPITLTAVGAYDPPPGNGQEHDNEASQATDSSTATYWETEHYRSSFASLGKHGVGLVLDAGSVLTVHHVTVTSDTPGFTAEIQAGNTASGPFHAVSDAKTVGGQTTFDLQDAHARYLVVWITNLGPLSSAHVNNISAS